MASFYQEPNALNAMLAALHALDMLTATVCHVLLTLISKMGIVWMSALRTRMSQMASALAIVIMAIVIRPVLLVLRI